MFAELQPPQRLHSIGKLAELLQASPGEIEQAARVADVSVVVMIDERPYFADGDLNRLRAAIHGVPDEPMH